MILERKKFNEHLSRARRIVENAFGILAQKWRIFLRPINTDVQTAELIVKAACCLHNYIIIKNHADHEPIRALSNTRSTNRRSNTAVFDIRERFADYFNR